MTKIVRPTPIAMLPPLERAGAASRSVPGRHACARAHDARSDHANRRATLEHRLTRRSSSYATPRRTRARRSAAAPSGCRGGAIRPGHCKAQECAHTISGIMLKADAQQCRQRSQHWIERQRLASQEAAHQPQSLCPISPFLHHERHLAVRHGPKPRERIVERPPCPKTAGSGELISISVRHDEHIARLELHRRLPRRLAPAIPLTDDVIRDDVLRVRQDHGPKMGRGGRFSDPRCPRIDRKNTAPVRRTASSTSDNVSDSSRHG